MKTKNRRTFLKLSASLAAGSLFTSLLPSTKGLRAASQPGVIILVLDALSARNMSLYGYHRKTTPNFEKIAGRANLYHAHHSAGTFTTAGTSSLLTGMYPWTHRAINIKGLISRNRAEQNIFHALGKRYERTAFTQNYFAEYILSQFQADIESLLPLGWNSAMEQYAIDIGQADFAEKFRSFDGFLLDYSNPAALVFGTLYKYIKERRATYLPTKKIQYYQNELIYSIKDIFSGISERAARKRKDPPFSYFHVFPPHAPYLPRNNYKKIFLDNWSPAEKPKHALNENNGYTQASLNKYRLLYDQYLAMTDSLLGTLFKQLDESGALDNNYLVITSDHGESFERGYRAHAGPFVYEPSVQVPLLIVSPGQNIQNDFYVTTNSVDVVPTLLSLLGYAIPDWCEGVILPGFTGYKKNAGRVTFSMDAKQSSASGNLDNITVAMFKEQFKLIYYKYLLKSAPFKEGTFELYDLAQDPEELDDLFDKDKELTKSMLDLFMQNRRDIAAGAS